MKIVKRYKWYKKKENKNIFHKIKIKKNVITYLIKIWLCTAKKENLYI